MSVKLLDAVFRETTGFEAFPSISKDGSQAYFYYDINVTPTSDVIAERFDISSEKFVSQAVLHGDIEFVSADAGFATNDFKLFSALDDNQSVDTPKARIRILGPDLGAPKAERIFTDAFLTGFTFFGGAFSPDGRYTEVNYVVQNTRPTQTSTLKVLRTSDLATVAETTLVGVTGSIPQLFVYCQNLFLAVAISQGILDFNQDIANVEMPPYKIQVYQVNFDKGTLDLVTEATLPQGVASLHAECVDGQLLIYFGTRQALLNKEKSIFVQTPANTSATPNNGELRIYSFDGENLALVKAQHFGYTIEDVALFDQKAIFNLVGVRFLPGFFQVAKLDDDFNIKKYSQGNYTNPLFFVVVADNLVLIGTASSAGVKNVQLWRLVK